MKTNKIKTQYQTDCTFYPYLLHKRMTSSQWNFETLSNQKDNLLLYVNSSMGHSFYNRILDALHVTPKIQPIFFLNGKKKHTECSRFLFKNVISFSWNISMHMHMFYIKTNLWNINKSLQFASIHIELYTSHP